MPRTDHTVGEDWFSEDNDDKLTDAELLADAERAAKEWARAVSEERLKNEERTRQNWKRGAHR